MGTVAALPFDTLMVVAPKAELTRKCVRSSVPFIGLGVLYAYLLYLSWAPDTFRPLFASKYWLPELPGIARMFSNDMTLGFRLDSLARWTSLLSGNAGKSSMLDWRTRSRLVIQSRSALIFFPVGITAHFITKALTDRARNY